MAQPHTVDLIVVRSHAGRQVGGRVTVPRAMAKALVAVGNARYLTAEDKTPVAAPVAPVAPPAAAPATAADPMAGLRADAGRLGITVDGRWGEARLRAEIEAAKSAAAARAYSRRDMTAAVPVAAPAPASPVTNVKAAGEGVQAAPAAPAPEAAPAAPQPSAAGPMAASGSPLVSPATGSGNGG